MLEASSAQVGTIIVDSAREWHAQLIVCGTHGRRGIARWLMGSDAEQVLRTSPVPVLLVRQGSTSANTVTGADAWAQAS